MSRFLRTSPSAFRDVERLVAFLDADSPAAGARVRAVLQSALESLRDLPDRGHLSEHKGYRELIVAFGHAGYIVRYRVDPTTVTVTRIRHTRERR